jgi:protein-S-isoprenylcysteine O-methyltransferase Ste14
LKKDIIFLIAQFITFTLYVVDPFYVLEDIPAVVAYIAIFFMIVGVIIIFFGILNLNDNLGHTTTTLKNTTVFFRGIYKYVRHPIYAGMLIVMLAVAFYMNSWFKGILSLTLGVIFYYKSSLEEKKLMEQYLQYEEYTRTTGRFFPRLRHIRSR